MKIENWRAAILSFESAAVVDNPFLDVRIFGYFTGPSGRVIRREAYWDGGNVYRISFAPTEVGCWKYRLTAPAETGLDGVSGELECIPYSGGLPVYQHGFLRVGGQGRYLCHDDGTPFFWLGDTHWGFVIAEPWETEPEDYTNSFRGIVDLRWEQGFTVYQSNLRTDGFFGKETDYWEKDCPDDLPNVRYYQQEVDRRMQYIADKGFVNALGLSWATMVLNGGLERQKNLARYIVARYGALPVVWTLAGEVAWYTAKDRQACIDGWREVALVIEELDGYGTLQTAHYTNERPFASYYQDEPWFDFTMNQAGHGDFPISASHYREHRSRYPDKPFVESEAMYEFTITLEENGGRPVTADMIRRIAYLTMQTGGCGYSYGTMGILPTKKQKEQRKNVRRGGMFDQGTATWEEACWSDGVRQLGILRKFYEGVHFERLRPFMGCLESNVIFSDETLFGMFNPFITASDDMSTVVLYFSRQSRAGGSAIRYLKNCPYTISWFDPRTGETIPAAEHFRPVCGRYILPDRPDRQDWLMVLQAEE